MCRIAPAPVPKYECADCCLRPVALAEERDTDLPCAATPIDVQTVAPMPLHIQTPLIESQALSSTTGREIWLKMEALQPTGSFKLRGIGAVCEHSVREGKRRFIASSGGNAGIAVAYAGRHLSIPVLVVVPETTTAIARERIEREN